MQNRHFRYFIGSFWIALVGLLLGCWVGYLSSGTLLGALNGAFVVTVLSVLEISLSFDNAVLNASVLTSMTPEWRRRFLTWGMLIAVFGMRLFFPLLIVGLAAHLNPVASVLLAAHDPARYAQIMDSVQVPVSAFGGAFLSLVGLKYFLNPLKKTDWIVWLEKPLRRIGQLPMVSVAVVLTLLYFISTSLSATESGGFMLAGIAGVVIFILVDGVSDLLGTPGHDSAIANAGSADGRTKSAAATVKATARASASLFIYLEVLDASFSFDGVVGAFAVTTSLFIITIGLSIGAMFVRSLTMLIVDRGTLGEYIFVEHGAFYAILTLAAIMFISTFVHVPEVLTGLLGAAFILAALISSVFHKRATSSGAT
jgi:hypothetical protein